jgi:superfamily II DNA or RNA helicase
MARPKSTKSSASVSHKFRDKLLLNQWLISLFGIDPLKKGGKRPFHCLSEPLRQRGLEGFGADKLHRFFHYLGNAPLLSCGKAWTEIPNHQISREQLQRYEENIVSHTLAINEKRHRPVVWKYYQWLNLLFVEVYLDRYFSDKEGLLAELNAYVERFNAHWRLEAAGGKISQYKEISPYELDDLNKLCIQSATGSGKTLVMHANLLQYRHYAKKHKKDKELSRVILLTPNEQLSKQHLEEFQASGIQASSYLQAKGGYFAIKNNLNRVDILEITKLADKDGPQQVSTRSFGGQNLLLVDEGHRGMSGKEEGVWFTRRSQLCSNGFTFEYSATFDQAVGASANTALEDTYAKAVIYDYSYRWFYEDGFGKDYQILNLTKSIQTNEEEYLTLCLLKFYQQLRLYEENTSKFVPFNLEKPLWVFVGSTVSKAKGGSKDEKIVAADVAKIIQFVADFLSKPDRFKKHLDTVLYKGGLADDDGHDLCSGAFAYLLKSMAENDTNIDALYRDIMRLLFNNPAGGELKLKRIKGESGEIALCAGTAEAPFGLINVGNAKDLCDHMTEVAESHGTKVTEEESDFTEAMFATVKESSSSVNLLLGSKKFVEGWDCWRVSTMGLMHVGKSEGAQIIQLFGRGVRLKGYDWSLKRSGHLGMDCPSFIEELETLNVFGIEANFMAEFRKFLKDEGLPGNERRTTIIIPLNVTHDFGKGLKVLRPKKKSDDGREYDFKKDAPVPCVGEIPAYLTQNPVKVDWYPRIEVIRSKVAIQALEKDDVKLGPDQLALLNYDDLFFELERFKRERSWYNLNISKSGIETVLQNANWYILHMPQSQLNPSSFDEVHNLQNVTSELLRRYCEKYYDYRKREFLEPRLELRPLTRDDDNIPSDDVYRLIVDGSADDVISGLERLKKQIAENKQWLISSKNIDACMMGNHLYQPLFHVKNGNQISVMPVALNESEFEFVTDLKNWCDSHSAELKDHGREIFLLRNMSRGKGVGFFEAGGFYPDFIMWVLEGGTQYVTFLDPHGLLHGSGLGDEKILFHRRIKDIERRMNQPDIVLNSFVLSWSEFPQLKWGKNQEELEKMHVLFMKNDKQNYLKKLFERLFAA